MANTKKADRRIEIIDSMLQSRRGYSTSEMMEKINDIFDDEGYSKVSSLNTIRDDIFQIEYKHGGLVEEIPGIDRRNRRLRYIDPKFSIWSKHLNEKELSILKSTLEELSCFEGRPQFEWLEEVKLRIQSTMTNSSEGTSPIVGFEENKRLKGRQYYQQLFDAIRSKHTLLIRYKTFKDKCVEYTMSPYYLKQFNNRWFLFGINEGFDVLTNCALDRIESIAYSDHKYIPNNGKYDFQTYFNDIIGVSRNEDEAPIKIRLFVENATYPYISTKPLHHTQDVVKSFEDGVEIILNVVPNFELEQQIISYADGVRVLEPEFLRRKIEEKVRKILEKYNTLNLTESNGDNFAAEINV